MDADPRAMPGLKNHLADIVKWQGKYECIAPVEVLQCILASFENYGILATQNDVTELLAIMHDKMNVPEASERLWCMFLDHMDAKTYVPRPADLNSRGEAAPVSNTFRSISEYLLEILQPLTGRPLEVPAERILITKIPVYGSGDDNLRWIPYSCTDWDSIADLSFLFGKNTEHNCSYRIKAAIFHVHSNEAAANMTAGHYVNIIKQGDVWHLCDDEVVRPLDLRRTPYPPCCVYVERCDVVSPAKPCLTDGDLQLLPWADIAEEDTELPPPPPPHKKQRRRGDVPAKEVPGNTPPGWERPDWCERGQHWQKIGMGICQICNVSFISRVSYIIIRCDLKASEFLW